MSKKTADTQPKLNRNSLGSKVSRTYTTFFILILAIAAVFTGIQMFRLVNTARDSINDVMEVSEEKGTEYLTDQVELRLQAITDESASKMEELFAELGKDVTTMADMATRIESDPSQYSVLTVSEPDAANDGKLSAQVLFMPGVSKTDTALLTEAGRLWNVMDLMLSQQEQFDTMASNYLAAESGVMVQSDYIAGKKFDENGNVMSLDFKSRPWYVGAKETGKIHFTSLTQDAHTDQIGIMCGVPFYDGSGNFKGVAGAGMYLDAIEETLDQVELEDTGFCAIVNANGEVVFSTADEGLFAEPDNIDEAVDIRKADNDELNTILGAALKMEKGIGTAKLDGKDCHVAYAPMETVGWTVLTVLPEEEFGEFADKLNNDLQTQSDAVSSKMKRVTWLTLLTFLLLAVILMGVSIWLSLFVSRKYFAPLTALTKTVERIQGGSQKFDYDLKTGDEIETLADTFKSLLIRIRDYIKTVHDVTAERERISTELNVATQIQSDMLPQIFPPFPEKEELDIYATMEPAKEVGGDFYDFFLVDDTHLAVVVADVSGKGVPAALFMVISKTLIKNRAMMGGTPAEILAYVNNQLCEGNKAELFVTVWLGILDLQTGEVVAANAGHEYPVLRDAKGQFSLLKDKHGFVMAGMEDVKYKDYTFTLEPGGGLFVYTDGVPEATNMDNELFGTDRMLEALNKHPEAGPIFFMEDVRHSMEEFTGNAPQFDDVTMVGLVWKGTETRAHKIVLDADDKELPRMAAFIEETLEKHNCPMGVAMQIQVAAEELFVNIAHYGYPDGEGKVQLTMDFEEGEPETLVMHFLDGGVPFNPLEREDPDVTLSAEEREIGGLGIYMVRKTMDDMSYAYEDRKNILTIRKKLEAKK